MSLFFNQEVLSFLTEIAAIAIPALLGSYAKDYLDVITEKKAKTELSKIFLSAVTATFTIYAVTSFQLALFDNFRMMMFLSFIVGLLGFQLLQQFSTIEGVGQLVSDIQRVKKGEPLYEPRKYGMSEPIPAQHQECQCDECKKRRGEVNEQAGQNLPQ